MNRLKGKSALITGAARGIGRGFAQKYIDEGAQVAIADIDLDAAKKTASELGPAAYPIHIDVSDQNSIEAAISDSHLGLDAGSGIFCHKGPGMDQKHGAEQRLGSC